MKFFFITLFTIIVSAKIKAQGIIISEYNTNLDTNIYKYPQFSGGYEKFSNYVQLKTEKALRNNFTERTVIARLTIEKTGKVKNPKIVRNIGPILDSTIESTIISVLKKSPMWNPGQKKGQSVGTELQIMIDIPATVIGSPVSNDKPIKIDPNKIYISVQQPPEFPGGQEKLDQFIKVHQLLKKNLPLDSGRVFISCIVEKNGKLSNIKVVRGVSNIYNSEALVLVKQLPKWHPGIQEGKAVRVRINIPVLIKR